MKTKKLLRKVKALLSADQRAQIAKYDSLEKVLKKLREGDQGSARDGVTLQPDSHFGQDAIDEMRRGGAGIIDSLPVDSGPWRTSTHVGERQIQTG
jgi:hypothetical protein